MAELATLDVQQSLRQTLEVLLEEASKVDAQLKEAGGALSEEGRASLELIGKKVDEAEAFFARALDSRELYERLSDIHARIGDSAGAERFARQGRMFLADAQEFEGRLQAFYGNNTKALEHFDAALKLIPDHALALKAAEGARKRIAKATHDLAKLQAAAQAKKTAKDWTALGSALADLGRVDEALPAFEEAVRADPQSPEGWARKGTALHAMGKVADALEAYKRAVAIKPTSMVGRRGVNYATYQIEHPGDRPEG